MVATTMANHGAIEINFTGNVKQIEFPDGSVITGTITYTLSNGETRTVGELTLQTDGVGHDVEQVETTNLAGDRVQTTTAFSADGSIALTIESTIAAELKV